MPFLALWIQQLTKVPGLATSKFCTIKAASTGGLREEQKRNYWLDPVVMEFCEMACGITGPSVTTPS